MTRYIGMLAAAALVAGCASEEAPEAPEVTAMAVTATDPALEKVRDDYETHFNMHHASVVGDLYSDSAVAMLADGSVDMGKAAIIAGMEASMAASPTLDLTTLETMKMGDVAITTGRYQLGMTPPGAAAVNLSGHYMTLFRNEGGAWKIDGVVTNYDAPPPDGLPAPRASDNEPPPNNGTLTDLYKAVTDAVNSGNAAALASLYTEDAIEMPANEPLAEGRAAIEASAAQVFSQGPVNMTLHPVNTMRPVDGWAIDGGWYESKAGPAGSETTFIGAYMLLARQGDDGSWKIHRLISNSRPVPAS